MKDQEALLLLLATLLLLRRRKRRILGRQRPRRYRRPRAHSSININRRWEYTPTTRSCWAIRTPRAKPLVSIGTGPARVTVPFVCVVPASSLMPPYNTCICHQISLSFLSRFIQLLWNLHNVEHRRSDFAVALQDTSIYILWWVKSWAIRPFIALSWPNGVVTWTLLVPLHFWAWSPTLRV
jgi:hypothetical protein